MSKDTYSVTRLKAWPKSVEPQIEEDAAPPVEGDAAESEAESDESAAHESATAEAGSRKAKKRRSK